MSTTRINTPTSLVRFGYARIDITPPVGIYHRLWGAARHDRATGVHRPLVADVMVFAPVEGISPPLIQAKLDLCGLVESQHEALTQALGEAAGVPRDRVVISYSHTHSSGWFIPDRFKFPGGELIPAYLEELGAKLSQTCPQAMASLQDATITYGTGRCNMAANRDYWDELRQGFSCGFNPDAPADDTVVVARITDSSGRLVATLVNYGCHPTTLAWENTLISPDYIGAMREEVERALQVPCLFAQGACGDLGPRDGFVGDTAVADRNGRQLAYAALSALAAMGPAGTDFQYQGAVVSGATLGTWAHVPLTAERQTQAARFDSGRYTVDLPLKPRPDRAALREELADWEARQQAADARGDAVAARDCGAHAERARRWLARLDDLPEGPTFPLPFYVHRMGDAVWVACSGEPYSIAQVELRRRFPAFTLLFSPLSGALQVAYLLPAARYGKGLYQEEPSILAPGCLEQLIDAIAARIEALTR
jgi:hypothetical protein